MQLKKNHKIRNVVILAIAVILASGGAVFGYFQLSNQNSGSGDGDAEQNTTITQPENLVPASNDQTVNNSEKTVPMPTADGNSQPVQPNITYASKDNGIVSVSALLDAKEVFGKCKLELTDTTSGKMTSYESDIVRTTSYSCGFDIPVTSSGGWSLKLINVVNGKESLPDIMELQ
ncbi:MAG: hypothetical protein LBL08_00135 [Candidatus Nomurabacteria bacterium]|jgi:hypothetical protein|nr:hypothetical protein [Candidatus Nomurabacteria bacterium]